MDTFRQKYEVLQQVMETESGSFDTGRAQSLVQDLKEFLINSTFLSKNYDGLSFEEHILYRNVLEYDAIVSIKTRNFNEFERSMAQLKCSYAKELNEDIEKSEKMPILISVYLVYLLSQNKMSEFNVELNLSQALVKENEYFNYVEELNNCITDNSLSQLFELAQKPPSSLFNIFTANLLEGARNTHADSIQKCYRCITPEDLVNIFHFNSVGEARVFAKRRGWVENDGIYEFQEKTEFRSRLNEKAVEKFVDLAIQISSFA